MDDPVGNLKNVPWATEMSVWSLEERSLLDERTYLFYTYCELSTKFWGKDKIACHLYRLPYNDLSSLSTCFFIQLSLEIHGGLGLGPTADTKI